MPKEIKGQGTEVDIVGGSTRAGDATATVGTRLTTSPNSSTDKSFQSTAVKTPNPNPMVVHFFEKKSTILFIFKSIIKSYDLEINGS